MNHYIIPLLIIVVLLGMAVYKKHRTYNDIVVPDSGNHPPCVLPTSLPV